MNMNETKNEVETETWYEIENSRQGENDWYRESNVYDQKPILPATKAGFENRLVKVTVTRQVTR